MHGNHQVWGDCDGYYVLVAAPSAHAASLLGRKHGFTITKDFPALPPDVDDVELALAHPGELYWRPGDGTDDPWRRAG